LAAGGPLLVISISVGGYWCMSELHEASQRQLVLQELRDCGGDYQPVVTGGPKFSFIRQWYKDVPIATIWLPKSPRRLSAQQIKEEFPEAQLLSK
jgi:hypothetical protein